MYVPHCKKKKKKKIFGELCIGLANLEYKFDRIVACVAAVSFPFPGGDLTSERKLKRASEGARLG